MAQGEFALVRENLEKAFDRTSMLVSDADLYAMLVDAAVQQRDAAGIMTYAPILEASATDLEHKLYLAIAHRAWGVLKRLNGEFSGAAQRLRQAATIFEGLDARWQLGRTYYELGELARQQSHKHAAGEYFADALSLFEALSAVPDAARVRAALDAN